ncbi:E1-E2 ATPase-domain-containing protein [Thamnocephalis sphaerospora]|uniref:E1-E2 ATPase-domain-containing protein n=1 Tax=Thamnocephalis sphaerospora TaxID=78915 RepID=A0A4P9XSM4_9FUNG|nr:E1-E2 ATPase-domain-containing protein [Thamnocephalis sphaerospora]|eukprot:RKP09138.1 E1-E2 ATPase-domain-containing protein [Thamnocephalis sphaerospora]
MRQDAGGSSKRGKASSFLDEAASIKKSSIWKRSLQWWHAKSRTDAVPKVQTFSITYDMDITGPRTLIYTLQRAGIEACLPDPPSVKDRSRQHQRRMLLMLLACAVLTIPAVVIELGFPHIMHMPQYNGIMARELLMLGLTTPVQAMVWPFYVSTYRSLRYSREVTMDALLTLSTTVGYVFSVVGLIVTGATDGDVRLPMFFDMNAMLVLFFLLGRYLHDLGKGKAARTLAELKQLQTSTAPITGDPAVVDVRLVQRRDTLLLFSGESIPVDGLVVEGSGDVDESLVTGEAMPVEKQPGARVTGGTILVSGELQIRCTKTAAEGTLSEIARLIESAQASKISVQKLADKVATIFCPSAIALSLVVFFVWLGLTLSGAVTDTDGFPAAVFALNFFIATLVVACPCAISLAVPTVLVVATGLASKLGILVRDGNAFEQGAKATAVVFDKTGTLTEGAFSRGVVDTDSQSTATASYHAVVGAAATASRHPVSRALSRAYAEFDDAEENGVTEFVDTPGDGYTALVSGERVTIGKLSWVLSCTRASKACFRRAALTVGLHRCIAVVVAYTAGRLHAYALEDRPRANAAAVIANLRAQKLSVHLVSGDNVSAVQRLAEKVGIAAENAQGACLPGDKVEAIKRLQKTGHIVVFVGDGVNDAPVLAQSHLGVALSSGAEVTMEAARAVLMRNDLADVVVLLDICRAVMRRIRINFVWSFSYNVFSVPSAAGVFYALDHFRIPPAFAGLGSVASVIPVLLTSLLLRTFYRPPRVKPLAV